MREGEATSEHADVRERRSGAVREAVVMKDAHRARDETA